MKQLAWILPVALVGIGCDPQVEPIETVRNDVIETVAGERTGVTINSIQLRIRAELDDETQIEIFPSSGFEGNVLGGAAAAANPTGAMCEVDGDCAGPGTCIGATADDPNDMDGVCWAYPEVGTQEIDCNIYDIRFEDDNGNLCEQTINSALIDDPDVAGIACTANADCAGPYRCINDSCTAIDGTGCEETADCTGGYTCVADGLPIELTDATDGSCTFTEGVACQRAVNCGGPFLCRDGACRYDYQGDGAWLCYIAERWDLSNHVSAGSCPAFFPE